MTNAQTDIDMMADMRLEHTHTHTRTHARMHAHTHDGRRVDRHRYRQTDRQADRQALYRQKKCETKRACKAVIKWKSCLNLILIPSRSRKLVCFVVTKFREGRSNQQVAGSGRRSPPLHRWPDTHIRRATPFSTGFRRLYSQFKNRLRPNGQ